MSKRRELQQKLTVLGDMQTVVFAMKSLALMESKKLLSCLAGQGSNLSTIRAAATDFLKFYPLWRQIMPGEQMILIAVGADRGFCGDFNQEIARTLVQKMRDACFNDVKIIAVGERLYSKLRAQGIVCHMVAGATCMEDVPDVLSALVGVLAQFVTGSASVLTNLKIFVHPNNKDGVSVIEPILELEQSSNRYTNAPYLTLDPLTFFCGLLEQYLEAVLYQAFYGSLLAENTRRIMHLDTAGQRLESKCLDLKRRYNALRQEEITEEIEIIIMNAQRAALPN